MPDISYQMQLMNAAQNSPMQALDTLMGSIGKTWQNREARDDEQAAVSFFTQNDVTPETMQQFSTQHPNMPMVDVYKYASAIATQKKARTVKDAGKTYSDLWIRKIKEGAIPTPKEEAALMESMDSDARDFLIKNREPFLAAYGPKFHDAAKTSRVIKMTPGLDPTVVLEAEAEPEKANQTITVTPAGGKPFVINNQTETQIKKYEKGAEGGKYTVTRGEATKGASAEESYIDEQMKLGLSRIEAIEKYKQIGGAEKPSALKGFDFKGKPVYLDPQRDTLVYADKTPYVGGQLKPVTEPAQVTVLNQSTDPGSMEKLADAIEAGRTTMSTVAKGMGGAHTAREVSIVLEGRGVDVASLEANLAAKRQALGALEKTVNQLKPFEETARRNLEYASSLSHKYIRSKYPDLNRLKIMWDQKTGDPLVEKFKVATYDGMMEAMKHMLAGSGITAAELSVGAQKRSEELLRSAQSWEQFDAVIEAINVGLVNRANAYKEQLKKLKEQSIVNFTPPAEPSAAKPIGDMGGAKPSTGPKVGEVQKGYRFKGGNPADKNSWEKT